jgi:hypothetical protein
VLEPLFGLLACLFAYLGVAVYQRVTSEFVSDRAFERWCASQPIVLAFHCRSPDRAVEAKLALRTLLGPHEELENASGGAPWQYYRYDVVVRAIADDVVVVQIVDAILQRGSGLRRPDAAEVVRRVAADARADVDEIWIHAHFHDEAPASARGPSSTRTRTGTRALAGPRGWLGRVVRDGEIEFTPMIGRPAWSEIDRSS